MDLKQALIIFEIENDYTEITFTRLKKIYHKLSLKNHPDKNNNSVESTQKFRLIKEAYDFLIEEFNLIKEEDENDNMNEYTNLLNMFIKNIFQGDYNEIISEFIKNVVNGYIKTSLQLFENIDKDTAISIYSFLEKYKSMLHISSEILDKIRESVINKYNEIAIYKLNPTIKDLYENNIYKLQIENITYHVPLWHTEMYFDCSGSEIMVICEPELPTDVSIDEDNNIYIKKKIQISELPELMKKSHLVIKIYNKELKIPVSELFLRESQFYIFKKEGISLIKNNIYEIEEKSNLIVKIIIH
jgi:hypothetical protein